MTKILTFEKYTFITDNLVGSINEDSEFNQYQFGIQPFNMPNYGFAVDPQLSIYGSIDSPYVDHFARSRGAVITLYDFVKNIYKTPNGSQVHKFDYFLDDLDLYENLKILRLVENTSGFIDIYISFEFDENEYFGVFKNFNGLNDTFLHTELFTTYNIRYPYMDKYYFLKLSNYFKKVIEDWFIPKKGDYKNLKKDNPVKNSMGAVENIPENATIKLLGTNINQNNQPYLVIKYKENKYMITGNNYYFFNYYFEKI